MDIPKETMDYILDLSILEKLTESTNLRKTFYVLHSYLLEDHNKFIEVKTFYMMMEYKNNYSYYFQLLDRFVVWKLLKKIKTPNTNKMKFVIVEEDKWKAIKDKLEKSTL